MESNSMTDNNKQAPQNTPDEIDKILTHLENMAANYQMSIKAGRQPESPKHTHYKAKAKILALITAARIDELANLRDTGKWFTENGYYCFECNTLTHPDSYRNTSGRLGIPYICSNCGEGRVTHSSHVSLEQIKRRIATLTNDKIEGEHGGLERRSDEK